MQTPDTTPTKWKKVMMLHKIIMNILAVAFVWLQVGREAGLAPQDPLYTLIKATPAEANDRSAYDFSGGDFAYDYADGYSYDYTVEAI